ncbi:MAG: hypothetical protein ABWX74_08720 [Aeromicrobium sp.]
MGWIRRNRGDAVAAVAIGGGILAVVLAFVVGSPDDDARATAPQTRIGSALADPVPDVHRGPTPEASPAATVEDRVGDARAPDGSLGTGPAPVPAEGLQGGGGTKDLPKQRITLTMTSTAPIGVIGYVVPTSLDDSHGVTEDVGTSWSLSTIGYGRPDYAQLFAQSGPTGAVITCTIAVNGRTTESRSTDGPYSQLFCQG